MRATPIEIDPYPSGARAGAGAPVAVPAHVHRRAFRHSGRAVDSAGSQPSTRRFAPPAVALDPDLHGQRPAGEPGAGSDTRRHRGRLFGVAVLAFLLQSCAAPPPPAHWHLTLAHTSFGPVEVLATTQQLGAGSQRLVSSSAATPMLRELPGAAAPSVDLAAGSFAFELNREDDAWLGASLASRAGDPIRLTQGPERIDGQIEKGWFRGAVEGRRLDQAPTQPLRNYPAIVQQLERTLRERLYDPTLVDSPSVQAYLARLRAVAARARDDVDLLLAGRWAWDPNPPFSHFELRRSHQTAAELTRHFDTLQVPGEPVVLERAGSVAILRVSTMMGENTRQRLQAAMREVVADSPEGLLVDLRGNPGGAFAVIDLIEPLLLAPMDLGRFQGAGRPRGPGADEPSPPAVAWRGDTLAGFWTALAEHGALSIHGNMLDQHYAGPVAVLVDAQTASAAELVAQALQDACRAVLVGERTAGRMLSGSYFDLGEGFQAYLPVGDYYTAAGRRIEGSGVGPDVLVEADRAEARALQWLATSVDSRRDPGSCAGSARAQELGWVSFGSAGAGSSGSELGQR